MAKCTILITTTDINEDLWDMLFDTISDQWIDIKWPIVLNTQSKKYEYSGLDISVMQLYANNSDVPWSERLIETLKRIESDYILFMLDDYYIKDRVNQSSLDKYIDWMEMDSDIAVLYLRGFIQANGKPSEKYPDFTIMTKNMAYRLNCQVALWRKNKLIEYLRPHENPWQMEMLGSKRIAKYNDYIYALSDDKKMPINYCKLGVLKRGKWILDEIEPLVRRYNWNIDYNVRGCIKIEENLNYLQKQIQRFSESVKCRANLFCAMKKSLWK